MVQEPDTSSLLFVDDFYALRKHGGVDPPNLAAKKTSQGFQYPDSIRDSSHSVL
jgi:hypothetical protein